MIKQALKFGIVGIGNTLLTIIFFNIFVFFSMDFIVANVIAYFIGMINSYFWNRRWVFRVTRSHRTVLYKFVIVNLVVLGINNLVLYGAVHVASLHVTVSQLLGTGVGMVMNFLLNRYWTFR